MATGSTSISTFDPILRIRYLQAVRDLFNDETTVWGWLDHKSTQGGRNMTGTVRIGRSFSHGAQAAGGTLPTPQTIALANVVVPTKYLYGTLKITNEILKQAMGEPGSSARALSTQIDGLTRDMKDNRNRMYMGDGAGTIGTVLSVSTNVLTLKDATDCRKFGIGQIINGFSTEAPSATQRSHSGGSAGAPTGVNFLVTAVTPATPSITVDDNTGGIVANDFLSYTNSRSGTTPNFTRNEPMGLKGAVDDSNPPLDPTGLFGISRATTVAWQSYVNSAAANRPISGGLLQAMLDGARISGGGKIDGIFSPFGVRAEYAELQQNVRRTVNTNTYAGNTSGGFKEFVEYNGIEVIPEKHCPQNTMIGVDKDALWIESWGELDWMDEDGSILDRVQTPGLEPAYFATLYDYEELFVHAPARCAKLEAITGADPVAGF